jgi:myo-inositol-1(or 4)-monophosphatase
MLNFAIQTAREAGRVLAEKFGRAIRVTNKGDIDLVTEADIAAERLIVERIRSYHPRHAILTEESGDVVSLGDAGSEYKWVIDPLDGTTNYAHGYPVFCVSVALEHEGRVVLGVVYDPTREELFAAERGQGATLNGRSLRVSETDELNGALLCTGFPYDVRDRGDFARHFRNFIMRAQSVRRDGSAALDLAYVAAGRFDGFYEEGLRPGTLPPESCSSKRRAAASRTTTARPSASTRPPSPPATASYTKPCSTC